MQLRATTAAPARIVPEIPLSRLSLFLRTVVCFFLSLSLYVCFSFFHLLFIVYRRGFSYLLSPIPVETLPPLLSLLSSPRFSSILSFDSKFILNENKKKRKEKQKEKEEEREEKYFFTSSFVARFRLEG